MDYYDEIFRAAALESTKCSLGPSPHSHHQHHAWRNSDGSPHIVTLPCPYFESVFINCRSDLCSSQPYGPTPHATVPPQASSTKEATCDLE
jgi:hypothetical protein